MGENQQHLLLKTIGTLGKELADARIDLAFVGAQLEQAQEQIKMLSEALAKATGQGQEEESQDIIEMPEEE